MSQPERDRRAVLEAVAQLEPKLRQSTPENIAAVSGVAHKAVRELLAWAERDGLVQFVWPKRLFGPSGWALTPQGRALVESSPGWE